MRKESKFFGYELIFGCWKSIQVEMATFSGLCLYLEVKGGIQEVLI